MSGCIDALVPVEGKSTVRVHLGAKTLEIARETADALGLAPGLAVDAELQAQLEAAADRRAAAALVLKHLRGRPHTRREVHDHLVRHGHAEATVRAVLADLETKGLVDDRRWAEWFVQGRLAHRPTGATRLVREMCARGVPRDLAEAAVQRPAGGELEMALAAAAPRLASARALGRERGLRRLAGFLSRRGFSEAVVRQACLRLFASEPAARRGPERGPSTPEVEET